MLVIASKLADLTPIATPPRHSGIHDQDTHRSLLQFLWRPTPQMEWPVHNLRGMEHPRGTGLVAPLSLTNPLTNRNE